MRKKSSLLILLVMFITSCGAGSDRIEYQDEGRLCVYASEPAPFDQSPQDFVADAPVYVQVTHHGCLSSSCTADRESACTIDIQSDVFTVSSQGGYIEQPGDFAGCTDDCAILAGTCSTAALPAGTYTIRHGADTLTLTIPSSNQTPPCVGQSE